MTRPLLGEPIARGSRSVVHAWGVGAVAKVPLDGVPSGWIREECRFTEAARLSGAPVPKVLGVEVIDGRDVGIYERIEGSTMWDSLMMHGADPRDAGRVMAELHVKVLALRPSITLPSQRARLECKIRDAACLIDPAIARALPLLGQASDRMSLCHGDFHPKNIVLAENGPIIVDWFDTSRGDGCADVARASLLLHCGSGEDGAAHLPGASDDLVDRLHTSYIERVLDLSGYDEGILADWVVVGAAARLAEGVAQHPLLTVLHDLCS